MKIAILPGDGIGPEIVDEAVRVLNALDEKFEMESAPVGGAGYEVVYKGTLLIFAGMPVYAWLKYRDHRDRDEVVEAEVEEAVEEAEEYGPAPDLPDTPEPPVHAA